MASDPMEDRVGRTRYRIEDQQGPGVPCYATLTRNTSNGEQRTCYPARLLRRWAHRHVRERAHAYLDTILDQILQEDDR